MLLDGNISLVTMLVLILLMLIILVLLILIIFILIILILSVRLETRAATFQICICLSPFFLTGVACNFIVTHASRAKVQEAVLALSERAVELLTFCACD